MKGIFKDLPPFGKLIILFGLMVVSFIAAMILTAITCLIYFKGDVSQLMNLASLNDITFMKHMQTIQSLCLFVGTGFLAAILFSKNSIGYLKLNGQNRWLAYFLVVLAAMFVLPLISWSGQVNMQLSFPESMKWIEEWMRGMESNMNDVVARFFEDTSFSAFFYNMIMIAIIPAIGEELLFRGVLQKLMGQLFKNAHIAILVTAFIFSAFHMQFLTFLPRFILGILFGYFFYWSKNIWLPILAHFVNNAMAVFVYTLDIQGLQSLEPTEKPISVLIAITSLGFVLIIMSAFRKVTDMDKGVEVKY